MRQSLVTHLAAFAIGLLGLVGVGSLHMAAGPTFAAVVIIGAIAAAPARKPLLATVWLALVAGLMGAYPASLWLGNIHYLGDEWQVAVGLVIAPATAGYAGYLGVAAVARNRLPAVLERLR